jgi:hypothetical protein
MKVNPTGTPPAVVTTPPGGGDGPRPLLGLGKHHAAINFVDPKSVSRFTGQPEWVVNFKCAMTGLNRKAWLDYEGVQALITAAFGRADRHYEGPELVAQEVGIEVVEFTRRDGTKGLKIDPRGFYSVTTFQAAPQPPAAPTFDSGHLQQAAAPAAPAASNPFGG